MRRLYLLDTALMRACSPAAALLSPPAGRSRDQRSRLSAAAATAAAAASAPGPRDSRRTPQALLFSSNLVPLPRQAPWQRLAQAHTSSKAGTSGWGSMASPATAAAQGADGGAAASDGMGVLVVYVTVPDTQVADALSSMLVERKLAACVNIVPGLTSVYWWDGKVNKDPELMLIIKTRSALLAELTREVKANHPYDECEVLALPAVGGSPSYLQWVLNSTKE